MKFWTQEQTALKQQNIISLMSHQKQSLKTCVDADIGSCGSKEGLSRDRNEPVSKEQAVKRTCMGHETHQTPSVFL